MPKPDKGQVLIKVAYSTVNPLDNALYTKMGKEGDILGSDGCGLIIEVGPDLNSSNLIGKKVAFLGEGY